MSLVSQTMPINPTVTQWLPHMRTFWGSLDLTQNRMKRRRNFAKSSNTCIFQLRGPSHRPTCKRTTTNALEARPSLSKTHKDLDTPEKPPCKPTLPWHRHAGKTNDFLDHFKYQLTQRYLKIALVFGKGLPCRLQGVEPPDFKAVH